MYRKTIYCYKLNRINGDFHAYDSMIMLLNGKKILNQNFIFYEKKNHKKLTTSSSSANNKSYPDNATQNTTAVTSSKQCIHFLRSER